MTISETIRLVISVISQIVLLIVVATTLKMAYEKHKSKSEIAIYEINGLPLELTRAEYIQIMKMILFRKDEKINPKSKVCAKQHISHFYTQAKLGAKTNFGSDICKDCPFCSKCDYNWMEILKEYDLNICVLENK